MRHSTVRFVKSLFALTAVLFILSTSVAQAAAVGTKVTIVGQPGGIAYDAANKLVFISNTTQNWVEVYSEAQGKLLDHIPVGQGPRGLAVFPDQGLLVVCNSRESTLTVISLATLTVSGSPLPVTPRVVTTPEQPISIAPLSDGTALVSTQAGLQTVDLTARTTTPVRITGIPGNSTLAASADRKLVFAQGGGTAFLYNPAVAAPFEQPRRAANTSVMAADQTGARFFLGDSQFDRQLYQTAQINPFKAPSPTIGGVAFSPDASRVYVGFAQNTSGYLGIMSSTDLKPISTVVLAEAVSGPMIVTPDGSRLFAISVSGLTVVDLTSVSALPAMAVSSRTVRFNLETCALAPATQSVEISNAGGGAFTWRAVSSTPGVTLDAASGSGPATLRITLSPTGINFRGTGIVANVTLTSDESISGDQTINIIANVRTPDQIGSVFPVDGYLTDLLVDDARGRIYLVNSANNQLEVFSLTERRFLAPVPVGSIPKAVTFNSDRSQLIVASLGSEYMVKLNANTLEQLAVVSVPHVPASASVQTGTHPFSIAQTGSTALMVATNYDSTPRGTVYRVDASATAAAALPTLATATNVVAGATYLAASADGRRGLIAEAASRTLWLFDATTGNLFPRPQTQTALVSANGNLASSADGGYFHVGVQLLNEVLVPLATPPLTITGTQAAVGGFVFAPSGSTAYRGVRSTATLNSTTPVPRIEKLDAAASRLIRTFNIAEALVAPPASLLLSVHRQLAVDGVEAVLYGISETGLEVLPLPAADAPAAPQIGTGGIVNGASFALAPAPVAPGSIASIFGVNLAGSVAQAGSVPLPNTLAGVCVTFDGIVAPLFSVSPFQINVQVPWEMGSRSTAQVVVSAPGSGSAPASVPLARQTPGIFTMADSGQGPGKILHSADFTFVSATNPARIGEVISIYATGLGPTSPSVGTGAAAATDGTLYPTTTPVVSIGGANGQVLYSGLAPGFVGLYQVDVRIPSGSAVGLNVPLTISFGNIVSNQATIALVAR